jgi:hypothetical protein
MPKKLEEDKELEMDLKELVVLTRNIRFYVESMEKKLTELIDEIKGLKEKIKG